MPSKSQAQHNYWLYKLHDKDSTDEERKTAKEFLDADKKEGLWQSTKKKEKNSHGTEDIDERIINLDEQAIGKNVISCMIKKDGKFLIVEHLKMNKFVFPAGKVDAEETFRQAVTREMWEELGLVIKEIELIYSGKAVVYKPDTNFVVIKVTDYDNEVTNKEPHKHPQMRWVSYQELLNLSRLELLGELMDVLIANNLLH